MRKSLLGILIYSASMSLTLALPGCGLLASKPESVAAACPEFPPPPEVVTQRGSASALKETSLLEAWEPLMDSFVKDLQTALDAYNRALAESFSGAIVKPLSPVSAPGGL